jgi:hypothetical protein
MTSQNIWFASVLLATIACGRTEITGDNATPPQTQTQRDGSGTPGETNQTVVEATRDQQESAPDASDSPGSEKSEDAEAANTGDDNRNDVEPPLSPQPAAVATATATSQSSDPNVVVFRIKPGTGYGPWNTPDDPIVARVGQTLEIKNDDSIQHWVHAGFADFTSHALSGIKPGASSRIQINNTRASGVLDHATGGAIYFRISN